MSAYLKRKFRKAFERGMEFWTSEDGTLMSLVILDQAGWQGILQHEFQHIFKKEPFDESRAKARCAIQEWASREYFDGNSGQTKGKVWRIQDEPTDFCVIEYDLAIKR